MKHDGQIPKPLMSSGYSDDGGVQTCARWPCHDPMETNGKLPGI